MTATTTAVDVVHDWLKNDLYVDSDDDHVQATNLVARLTAAGVLPDDDPEQEAPLDPADDESIGVRADEYRKIIETAVAAIQTTQALPSERFSGSSAGYAADAAHNLHDTIDKLVDALEAIGWEPRANRPDPVDADTDRVLADVKAERATHPARGYGTAHDDWHGADHLVRLAAQYARTSGPGVYQRTDLVKATSLLIAAIERHDRAEADRG